MRKSTEHHRWHHVCGTRDTSASEHIPSPQARRSLVVCAGQVSSNDFKNGMTVEIDGNPYRVVGMRMCVSVGHWRVCGVFLSFHWYLCVHNCAHLIRVTSSAPFSKHL